MSRRVKSSMHIRKIWGNNKHDNKHDGSYHDSDDDGYVNQHGKMHGSLNRRCVSLKKKMTIVSSL